MELGWPPGVDVVEKSRLDAALARRAELVGDDRASRIGEADVVERKLEGRSGRMEEACDAAGHVSGRLAAVRQGEDIYGSHCRGSSGAAAAVAL